MKIGVVGLGRRISGVIYGSIKQVEPDIQITGVVDPDEKGARERLSEEDRERAVFYQTLDEMVRKAKPDALFIGTRCNLHAPYAIQAAKYDIPLFLEKPVAINMQQALALEKAFENSRCRVVVSFPLRVSSLCVFARELIEKDSIGEPVHIMAWNYVPYGTVYWEEEYRNYKITQGLFLQKATHDFDYMMYLMGMPVVRIGAMATFQKVFGGKKPSGLKCSQCKESEACLESPENRKRNHSGPHERDHFCLFSVDCGSVETGTNEDTSSAIVEFPSGAHGVYTQVFFTRRDAGARGATVSGYMGTVKFDWYKNQLEYVRHHKPFSDTVKTDPGLAHFGGDYELARDLVKLVKDSKYISRTPIETGLASVYTCLAAKESYQKGKFVKVRQVGQER
ncbi:MAG TPA: Gfo/Idh/MocA family oxidoreductase [bacterium]|nr:Gfo/Idh/MocA family oxidoreductase [bacterium]HPP29885.1 Gfo/Idh/MocA family oxidoreductase [bacterium]